MYYLNDRKKNKNKKYIIFVLILISLFIIFSTLFNFGNVFHFLGKTIWNTKNNISDTIENSSNFYTKKNVFKQNIELKNENNNLRNKMLDYEIIERENQELKSILDRTQNPQEYILARVLAKPNKSPYDTLVIDIGKNHNLYDGQKVFAEQFFPIGEIVEIYENTALVKLYSSPDEVVSGEIDILGTVVDLVGRGGGNFEMNIPKDMSLESGRAVVLPGLNSRILAFVVDTISEAKDPTNKIILRTPVNINELKWVQILK